MVRGRVELKVIENKINRQVTFSKRRNGLLKKARELSVLCDAEVAVIVFSNRGKLFQFSSNPNMMQTLERYESSNPGKSEASITPSETQAYRMEYLRLESHLETLQLSQRQLLGEDLGSLSIGEVEQLELQLKASLERIKETMDHHLYDRLRDLRLKEEMRGAENIRLRRRCQETSGIHQDWITNASHGLGYDQQPAQPPPDASFYHAFFTEPAALVGYNSDVNVSAVTSNVGMPHGWPHGM